MFFDNNMRDERQSGKALSGPGLHQGICLIGVSLLIRLDICQKLVWLWPYDVNGIL
jgi:hypothetical protein